MAGRQGFELGARPVSNVVMARDFWFQALESQALTLLRFIHCRPPSSPRFSPVVETFWRRQQPASGRRHSSEDGPTEAVFTVPGVTPVPVPAHDLAASAPADEWETVTWGTGTAGPLTARFCALRVRPPTGRGDRWLLCERSDTDVRKDHLLHLPATTALCRFRGARAQSLAHRATGPVSSRTTSGSITSSAAPMRAGRITSCSPPSPSPSYRLNAHVSPTPRAQRCRSYAAGCAKSSTCSTSCTIAGSSACSTASAVTRRSEGDKVVLDGAGSPRLVLVREPGQLGVERTHPQLAFGARLVELAKPNRHVAANDDRAPASLDDDDLHAASVARRRDEPEPGKQLEFAVDRHVPHAGRLDPLANGVVVLVARVVELPTLDVERFISSMGSSPRRGEERQFKDHSGVAVCS